MRTSATRRGSVLRRGIAVLCLLATAAALGGCVYDPYTGAYVPYGNAYYGNGYYHPYYYGGYRYPYAYRGY